MISPANERAAVAAATILDRQLYRALSLPGVRLGAAAWPAAPGALPLRLLRTHLGYWHYWWHAHLVDLLVDAELHRPHTPETDSGDSHAADTVTRVLRGIRLRNWGRWTNGYYDDMAWLGLALERAGRHLGVHRPRGLATLSRRMYSSWVPEDGGGIPWRTKDQFFNAPANGPAAILLARTGYTERAVEMCDWMDATLRGPKTGLIIDGVKPDGMGGFTPVNAIYTYCQGVVLGAELEVLRQTREPRHAERIASLLEAIETHMTPEGIITGAGGGDGGLFMGILARYLALIATDLPADVDGGEELRGRAARLVTASADAAWDTRVSVPTRTGQTTIFSVDWRRQATAPTTGGGDAVFTGGAVHSSEIAERDLSVQLSAWMVLEAAVAVESGISEYRSIH